MVVFCFQLKQREQSEQEARIAFKMANCALVRVMWRGKPLILSGSTMSEAGRKARDILLGLMKTCRKFRLSFFAYLGHRSASAAPSLCRRSPTSAKLPQPDHPEICPRYLQE